MRVVSVLDQFLDHLSRCLNAESARRVVALGVSAPLQKRINTLAEGANEGLLSSEERAEYEALEVQYSGPPATQPRRASSA